MKKDELMGMLQKGLYWEDEFIIKYDSDSFWALLDGSLDKEKAKTIKELFSKNIKDTMIHKDMLRRLIDGISKGEKDEY